MNYEFKDYLLDFFDLGYEMLPCATLEFDRKSFLLITYVVVYFEKSEPFTFPIES
jgi:hypothetical protein